MKKYIIPLSIAAVLMASCSIEEESPVAVGGSRMTLTGDSHTATKVSIGEKDGEVYPLLWFTGDVISINSTDGTFSGEQAELYSTSSGSSSGTFQTVNDLVPASDMDLVILYPGSSLSYSNGVIKGSVPSEQTQRSANSSIHIGNGCFAYAETSVSAGQTEGVKFSLDHKTAFAKVVVNMSEYSGYQLSGISFLAEGFNLSGTVSYNVETEEMTVTDAEPSVKLSISNPSSLSEEQAVYFTVLPCDLTGEQVYVSVKMVNDTQTVEVPILIDGGKFIESCLSVIEISGSSLLNWYEPIETRDLLNGWAYGPQNTYFVEQKSNGNSITIDVKARGDFTKVKEPKYYGLVTLSSSYNNRNLCYLPDGTYTHQDEPTNKVSDDCTITVNVYSSSNLGIWSVVGIYDEDYNLLWSYMIWRYVEGDEPEAIEYTNDISFLDRIMGASYSNKLAAENGTFDFPYAYYQWGRKDPFMWYNVANYRIQTSSEGLDLADAIANPDVAYYTKEWMNDRIDFWGGENYTSAWYDPNNIGHKTVYDPCPAGYRVPDTRALYEVITNSERWEINNGNANQQEEWIVDAETSPFFNEGDEHVNNTAAKSCLAYRLSDGSYDYWPFAGMMWGDTWTNRAQPDLSIQYLSNAALSTSKAYGFGITYATAGYQDDRELDTRYIRTLRCQKDEENR